MTLAFGKRVKFECNDTPIVLIQVSLHFNLTLFRWRSVLANDGAIKFARKNRIFPAGGIR